MGNGVRDELCLERREVSHQQSRQITIFTQREQILFVQGVYVPFRVVIDDPVGNNDRASFIGSTNTIEGKATWETSHRAEQALEGFR